MRLLTTPEKPVEFIRPLYQGYSDWLDSSTKKIEQKTKLSFSPANVLSVENRFL